MQNNDGSWVKRGERGAIDPKELDLGGNEGDDGGAHHEEGDATTGASSSSSFDTQQTFKVILGRFDI